MDFSIQLAENQCDNRTRIFHQRRCDGASKLAKEIDGWWSDIFAQAAGSAALRAKWQLLSYAPPSSPGCFPLSYAPPSSPGCFPLSYAPFRPYIAAQQSGGRKVRKEWRLISLTNQLFSLESLIPAATSFGLHYPERRTGQGGGSERDGRRGSTRRSSAAATEETWATTDLAHCGGPVEAENSDLDQ